MFIYDYRDVEITWNRRNRSNNKGFANKTEMVTYARKKLGAMPTEEHEYLVDYATKYLENRLQKLGKKY